MADRGEILEATARVRLVREGVTKKLEQYRQQYEEMHIRALSAEMEAASVQMKLEQALRNVASHQSTVLDLVDQLGIERMRNTESETALRVAKEKIPKLRSKLKIEFDKVLHNQKELRVGINSFMRCIYEFRSGVISQEDFFCAVDLIFSSLVASDSSFASSPRLSPPWGSTQSSGHVDVLFNSSSLQELASLPPEQRRKRLELFIDRLSPDLLFSPTSDKLLSFVFEDSIPPPLPAKPSMGKFHKPFNLASSQPLVVPPPLPPRKVNALPEPCYNGLDGLVNGNNSKAPDSDSDFEESDEIQKIRHSTRASSDADVKRLAARRKTDMDKKRVEKKGKANIAGTKMVLRRSKSCDELLSDNCGSSGSEYSLPYQHLEMWHKMLSIRDSSVLTGSLPRLDSIRERDDEHLCYITPNEFRTFVCHVKGEGDRIDHKAGMRVMKRVDSLVKSYRSMTADPLQSDYLCLVGDDAEMGWLKKVKSKQKKEKATPPPVKSSKPRVNYENHSPPKLSSKPLPSKGKGRTPPPPQRAPGYIPKIKGSSTSLVHTSVSGGHISTLSSPPLSTPTPPTAPPTDNERFDDPVYEACLKSTPVPSPPPSAIHGSESPPIGSNFSRASSVPPKPHLVDIELRKPQSVLHSNEGGRPPALLPRPNPKPKPPPKPRVGSKAGIDAKSDQLNGKAETSASGKKGSMEVVPPPRFPDQIPTYCTLKRNTHSLRLVPQLCSDKDSDSGSEEDPGDYSLGTFQLVMNQKDSCHTKSSVKTIKASSSDSEEDSDGYETPPDATEGYIEPRYSASKGNKSRDRSYTTNLPLGSAGSNCVEKQGYMHKLDPSLRNWTKRWFVLKGKELKYFSKKSSRKPKGVINLETWCKISRHEMTSSFQLATPSRTYHFVADTNGDCEEWIKALQVVMRMCQNSSSSSSHNDIISGWVKVILKNSHSQNPQPVKCWVSILDQMLHVYQNSVDTKPLYAYDLPSALIKLSGSVQPSHFPKCTTSLLFGSHEDHTVLIEVGGADLDNCEESEEILILAFGSKEEQDLWFYHLISASSGVTGPELTLTEKLVARLWRSEKDKSTSDVHGTALWSNPLLMYTSENIQEPLLSHPSAMLGNEAVHMFKMVNLFITTQFDTLGLDYHIMSFQQLVSKCLTLPGLRDELYCQILRQISCLPDGPLSTSNILQGWFLLALLIPLFLPTRKIFRWYLEVILLQVSDQQPTSSSSGVSEAARLCYQKFLRAEKKGPREKTPSWFEVHYLMSGPIQISRIIQLKLKLPVNLMNDSTLSMDFDSSTDVQEFISQVNQEIGMPDSRTTGFALMSDWPGEDDVAGFYLFPNSKLCDVISTWSECLSELGSTNIHTRNIQLTYRKRLYFHSRLGKESDKEAVLLAYQMSKDVLNEYYYVGKVDLALDIAARMTQIDYGDFEQHSDTEQVARDAIRRFCPMKFTKSMLPHDIDAMAERLLKKWKGYHGINRHACARMLLSLFADNWDLFGSTLFHCMDRYSILTNMKNGPVWLAIHEAGITLLNANLLNKPIVTYSYKEVATFGSHGDDFMLVVNSRRRTLRPYPSSSSSSQATPFHTEKIILSMSKLKIREATYLMASYLDALSN